MSYTSLPAHAQEIFSLEVNEDKLKCACFSCTYVTEETVLKTVNCDMCTSFLKEVADKGHKILFLLPAVSRLKNLTIINVNESFIHIETNELDNLSLINCNKVKEVSIKSASLKTLNCKDCENLLQFSSKSNNVEYKLTNCPGLNNYVAAMLIDKYSLHERYYIHNPKFSNPYVSIDIDKFTELTNLLENLKELINQGLEIPKQINPNKKITITVPCVNVVTVKGPIQY